MILGFVAVGLLLTTLSGRFDQERRILDVATLLVTGLLAVAAYETVNANRIAAESSRILAELTRNAQAKQEARFELEIQRLAVHSGGHDVLELRVANRGWMPSGIHYAELIHEYADGRKHAQRLGFHRARPEGKDPYDLLLPSGSDYILRANAEQPQGELASILVRIDPINGPPAEATALATARF